MDYITKTMENGAIGKHLETFLATGNLKSRTGLDLMQSNGFSIIADKLNNMRFLSHFRSIHRGGYFAEMKTTTVRKLLAESWGFLCPVHTPDGAPCGLLNHITISCCPLTREAFNPQLHRNLSDVCKEFGMVDFEDFNYVNASSAYPTMINGRLAGYVDDVEIDNFVRSMRKLKCSGKVIPKETEIAYLKKGKSKNTIFPMLFITTAPSRLLRPVRNLDCDSIEWIGPLEQLFLDIDLPEGTHAEVSATNILSILPQHIPFINYNQSPRNMYQCQMAKQTMGTGVLNWPYRFDNKMYRILQSQVPIVRTKLYGKYKFEDYNSGSNAVVAVISYTGYDM
jgi:DNA-directed RNA polymerase I subunit RPA2